MYRQLVNLFAHRTSIRTCTSTAAPVDYDRLYSSIDVEVRGHDAAVLRSYTRFLQSASAQLDVTTGPVRVLPYARWLRTLLKSKFVHKKHKVHYETRTHMTRIQLLQLTGSTADTLLEYVQRNLPEGVAMKLTFREIRPLPEYLSNDRKSTT